MKILLKSLALATVLALFIPGLIRAQDEDDGGGGDQDASFQTFYDQLGDQGTWIQTDDYGYVFQPNVTDDEWQPYTDGYWADSDAGFTWVSDEPWGWATYHYGRWANIEGVGWVWVPGYEWAPAWVSWRYGGGYCGWAPLPPETLYGAEYDEPGVSVGLGFHFGNDVDVSFGIGAGCYNFIRVEDFGERDYRHHFVDRHNNFVIINQTNNITNININHRGGGAGGRGGDRFHRINAGGPPIAEINAHSRQHVQNVQFARANQPGRASLQGNTLSVYSPRVNPNSLHQDKPRAVGQTINRPTFNRGDSINKPLDVTRNIRGKAPSAEAVQAAQQAQAKAPAQAKIDTGRTPPRQQPNRSFNSLTPVVHDNKNNNPDRPGGQNFHQQGQAQGNNPGDAGNKPNSFHPQQQQQQTQTFHPEVQAAPQAPAVAPSAPPTFHPQVQNNNNGGNPSQGFHHEKKNDDGNNPQTFHQPQAQQQQQQHMENPNNGGFHPQVQNNNPPAAIHHEERHEGGGNPPAQSFHPQQQQPQQHTDNHPQNPGGQGQHPSGGQGGGNHPSGGGGKDEHGNDKKDGDKK